MSKSTTSLAIGLIGACITAWNQHSGKVDEQHDHEALAGLYVALATPVPVADAIEQDGRVYVLRESTHVPAKRIEKPMVYTRPDTPVTLTLPTPAPQPPAIDFKAESQKAVEEDDAAERELLKD